MKLRLLSSRFKQRRLQVMNVVAAVANGAGTLPHVSKEVESDFLLIPAGFYK